MGEDFHNKLKEKLYEDNYLYPIVKRVLKTNYNKMALEEFTKEIYNFLEHCESPQSEFVFLWSAAVAYSANNSLHKNLVFVESPCNNGVFEIAVKQYIIMHCGPVFREYPRLAYLKDPLLENGEKLESLMKFLADPKNEKFLDFWRKADNNDAPAPPDGTTDEKVELTKELRVKCKKVVEEVQEIQEKLLDCAI